MTRLTFADIGGMGVIKGEERNLAISGTNLVGNERTCVHSAVKLRVSSFLPCSLGRSQDTEEYTSALKHSLNLPTGHIR